MIDSIIMEAVMRDESSVGILSHRYNFIVMTGKWRIVEDDQGDLHILSTDNFRSPDAVLDVLVLPDSDIIEGERLIMYSRVLVDNTEFSLVVIKSQVYMGDADE